MKHSKVVDIMPKDKDLEQFIKEYASPDSPFAKAFMKVLDKERTQNTIVNPERMGQFINTIKSIKEYCKAHCSNYKIKPSAFEVSNANGSVEVIVDKMSFDSYSEFKKLIDGASWMSFGVTGDDRLIITIEFWGIATPVK